MDLSGIFKGRAWPHVIGLAAGGVIFAGVAAGTTAFGPDFTPMSRDAQRYNENVDFYERSFLDGDFISQRLLLPDVACPHGYAINEDSRDSRFQLRSWSTAYPQDENKPSLTLRFYSAGRCEKQVGDDLHILPFYMKHHADYNAYTEDQVLEVDFEEDSRIGEIVVQKREGGVRWQIPATRVHTLGPDGRTFNGGMIYVTLENFRVNDPLDYRTPHIHVPR